jgi:hypothetical protein
MGRKKIFLSEEEINKHISERQEKYRIEHREEINLKRIAKNSIPDTIKKLEDYITSLIEWNNKIRSDDTSLNKNKDNKILPDNTFINKLTDLSNLSVLLTGEK